MEARLHLLLEAQPTSDPHPNGYPSESKTYTRSYLDNFLN